MKKMFCIAGVLATVGACSPTHNWREVSFGRSTMRAMLPCKPAMKEHYVPLKDARMLHLQVAGCASGEAMVAVMVADLPQGTPVQQVLQDWQRATLSQLPHVSIETHAWTRSGWLHMPASVQIRGHGRDAQGHALSVEGVWGAVSKGEHIRVIHALVHAPQAHTALAQTLWEGLQP